MNVLVIIPAKMDSVRLPNKNMQTINDKPLIEYSIEYARESLHNVDIIVSSESDIVKEYCEQFDDVDFLKRPKKLTGDAEVTDVYIDIVKGKSILSDYYDLVVGLQPDNPDRTNTLDEAIQYMIDNNYDDLVTVNPDFKRSGSVRIFKYDYLRKKQVSKRVGCLYDDALDIHTPEDLKFARELMYVFKR